ncbi:nicotinate (nicotinamide) nucleotide adenylyltransferase [Tuwongella immobilis]|uniref:Probable nicotinate-nucleotide adenylyltransferase n=1 Tax=Tuwongella immobilis TaxID=692036 RepID=A0A6C2YPE3_9BACT|nr:nicotinate (nicotinamide) nucleotide adenylyltransferase [Tuwongella immobilis]VIP02905.1 nicotinic acid mononucleotide adenylyltransferase : Probable nicotinate-nucleotide adenylyltransferase OS=Planctomyces maris DSM 8797 GN=nadD PE=3 SV=1: CTP_transf_2 [Tuwongella immobilis]VTS02803.1 nicotinic acid mononucleotide adenylyltransferase : Probable nicotinate-nucleotide adenylyltransferase OS=Planctomyces maris DSM 8797 GN=nadD PE=3 SV=1: CTP_transf_2 [Tuwongella immobilis]
MRVGIFGGTFDPVHLGHLLVAEQAREQAELDEVWFLPAAVPPQKQHQAITPFDRRVEMLQLAVAGQPRFRIDRIESERSGPSYTVDTLRSLRQRHPQETFCLIVGADCIPDFPTWYQPAEILQLVELIVVERPGVEIGTREQLLTRVGLPAETPFTWRIVRVPVSGIASREIRRLVQAGRSIRYQVPAAVAVYIHEKGLYAKQPD